MGKALLCVLVHSAQPKHTSLDQTDGFSVHKMTAVLLPPSFTEKLQGWKQVYHIQIL